MTARPTVPAALLAVAIVTAGACSKKEEPPPPAATVAAHPAIAPAHSHGEPAARGTSGTRQPEKRYDGPLPPLPAASFVPPRSAEVVKAAYEFAGRRPDVLQYVPCFCMCERSGHVGNDDCFVSKRDPDGKPTWDLHGLG